MFRRKALPLVLFIVFSAEMATMGFAQEPAPSAEAPRESSGARIGKFLAGAATGLVLHEAGHAAAGWDRTGLPRRRGYIVTSAGFWVQYLVSEQVLRRHPRLQSESAPFNRGLLAFHVLTSTGYAALAFGKTGPTGRDTLGMANSLRVSERWVGALVLAPAVLDVVRYFHPEARWAAWMSRGFEIGSVALVIR